MVYMSEMNEYGFYEYTAKEIKDNTGIKLTNIVKPNIFNLIVYKSGEYSVIAYYDDNTDSVVDFIFIEYCLSAAKSLKTSIKKELLKNNDYRYLKSIIGVKSGYDWFTLICQDLDTGYDVKLDFTLADRGFKMNKEFMY